MPQLHNEQIPIRSKTLISLKLKKLMLKKKLNRAMIFLMLKNLIPQEFVTCTNNVTVLPVSTLFSHILLAPSWNQMICLPDTLDIMNDPPSELSQYQGFFDNWDPTPLWPLPYGIRMCTHLLVLYICTLI